MGLAKSQRLLYLDQMLTTLKKGTIMKLHFVALAAAVLMAFPIVSHAQDDAGTQLNDSESTSSDAATNPSYSDEQAHDTAGSTFDGNAINDPGVVDLRDSTTDTPALLRDPNDGSGGYPIEAPSN